MKLSPGFFAVAEKLQEAATAMCHEDIRTRLRDALQDAFKGTGNWCYVVAVFGDDQSGEVVYSCSDDLMRASYTMTAGGAKIDTAKAVAVTPLTTYEVETAEAKKARESKGVKHVSRETSHTSSGATLQLVESTGWLQDIALAESFKAGYQIKLIAPGKGSSAFYPAEVLKRDGPKVFKAGTPMRIDHPTRADEAARPEGSVKDWGAVLASDAVYLETHKEGPGLYGEIKPFSDHVQTIHEKGPYAGVSIAANGSAVMEAGRPVLKEGVPLLAALHGAEGVDMVTRAGAGGMFLSEAAKSAIQPQEVGMTDQEKQEVQQLRESNARIVVQLRESTAREVARNVLEDFNLSEAAKKKVTSIALKSIPVTATGDLDTAAFTESVKAEAKDFAAIEGAGAGRVTGMGGGAPVVQLTEAQRKEQADIAERSLRESESVFADLMGNPEAAKIAAKGRAN